MRTRRAPSSTSMRFARRTRLAQRRDRDDAAGVPSSPSDSAWAVTLTVRADLDQLSRLTIRIRSRGSPARRPSAPPETGSLSVRRSALSSAM